MKLLLTSGGVTNPSIEKALIELLGKPIAEFNALCVPTAQWGHPNPMCGPAGVRDFVVGEPPRLLAGMGWKSVGVLELTAQAELLPSLPDKVWVGVSAGSMVMTPRIGAEFVEWTSAPDDRTLGVVDFSIFPHLNHEMMPRNTLPVAEKWATGIDGPAYAIDDQTAITVADGAVDVVSEGQWKLLRP